MNKVIAHIKRFIVWIAPYAKRLFLMLKTNAWYLLWFFVYYYYTCSFLLPIFKLNTFIVCLYIYGISLLIAYFLGDIILCWIEGARPIETKREKEYLIPIFEEVYQDVKDIYPALPKIQLNIIDSLTVNAMAFGNHTIAITQGAIETFNYEELKGVLAHEISHIYHKDTKAVIMNTIGNGIFTILIVAIKLILKLFEFIAKMYKSTVVQAVFNLIRFVFELWIFVVLWLGKLILSLNSRNNELKADKFAYEAGYGEQLIDALYIIQKMSLGQKMDLVMRIQASHPRVSKRIGKLEALVDEEIAG